MKHFKAHITERGSDGKVRHLFPSYVGNVTKEFLIDFWGLRNKDVLDWDIEEFDD